MTQLEYVTSKLRKAIHHSPQLDSLTPAEALALYMGAPTVPTRAEEMMLAKAFAALGWTRKIRMIEGKQARCYYRNTNRLLAGYGEK